MKSTLVAPSSTLVSSVASTVSSSSAAVGGLVNTDGAALELGVVHGVHGVGSLIVAGVADEAETTGAASITVLDNDLEGKRVRYKFVVMTNGEKTYSLLNGSELLELLAESVIVSGPSETSVANC